MEQVVNPFKKIESDTIVVAYSGGKDSLVVLDMACKYMKKVYAFYMYLVKDLSFINRSLEYARRRYNIEIRQYPHPIATNCVKYGIYCLPTRDNIPDIRHKDIYQKVKEDFNCEWIALGNKQSDTYLLRYLLRQLDDEMIDYKRKEIYPVSRWSDNMVRKYIKDHQLNLVKIPIRGVDLSYKNLKVIKEFYPEDYEKVKEKFPLCDIVFKRMEYYGKSI